MQTSKKKKNVTKINLLTESEKNVCKLGFDEIVICQYYYLRIIAALTLPTTRRYSYV